jgi:hypothetical protein
MIIHFYCISKHHWFNHLMCNTSLYGTF